MQLRFHWFVALLSFTFAFNAFAGPRAGQLRCEYSENPLGIDASQPRLSWILEPGGRGQKQTAYQILVASSADELKNDRGDLWDSGKVASDQTTFVVYGGKPLQSRQACFWKVRSWDKDGKASAVERGRRLGKWGCCRRRIGRPSGLPAPRTSIISPRRLFRRAFTLDGKIKQARVYICGLGYYELHINGKKIGDHLLDPGYTRYDKRDLYVTYDVTDAAARGRECRWASFSATAGINVQTKAVWDFHKAPWRAAPKLLMQLRVEYADGHTNRHRH